MKRVIKKILLVCVFSTQLLSLRAAGGFNLPDLSVDGKNLYEMIGLDQAEYERRRTTAMQGVDTMDYDAIVAGLESISSAKKLLSELQKAKTVYDQLSGDDTGAAASLLGLTPAQAQEKLYMYENFLYQARELIKQERYKGQFDTWAKQEISSKCKRAQRDVRKEIDKIEQEKKFYPAEQTSRLQKQIDKAKAKLRKLAEGCTFLMDPKFRAQYDAELKTTHPSSRAFENVKDAVESSMRLAGTGTRIKLNAIIGDILSRELQIPDAATKLFNQDLELTDIRVLPKPQGEDIKYYVGFTGTTTFNTFSLAVNVYVIWDIYNKMRFSIGIETPDNYRLTNMFPKLRALNWMQFPKGKFVAANFKGTDIDGYSFEKGFNFVGQWDFFLSGPLSFMKKLASSAPQIPGLNFKAEPVRIDVVIPKWNLLRAEAKATIPLEIGVDFTKITKLPKAFTSVINGIHLTELAMKISPSAPTLERQQSELQRLEDLRDTTKMLSERNSEAKHLKDAYEQAEKKYESEKRRVGGIEKDKAKAADKKAERRQQERGRQPTEPIAQRAGMPGKTYREGVTQAVRDAAPGGAQQKALLSQFEKFGFTAQMQGIAELKLGTQSDPLRLIASGLVQPPGLKHPQGFLSFAMRLDNMLEFGWLALGNVTFVIDMDVAAVQALIALGIPISGISLFGQVDLGKPGESRASLKGGGGISITAKKPIDVLILELSGENIRPTDFARFVGYQLMKSQSVSRGVGTLSEKGAQLYNRIFPKSGGAPSLSLPELIFHKVWGYAALGSATIGKQTYRSGLGLQVELELMKQKAGMKIFIADQEKGYSIEGFGYGPPLSLSIKGRDLIKMYSAQDPAKGPYITWNFNPKALFSSSSKASRLQTAQARAGALKDDLIQGALSLDAVLELPMMGLKQKAKFKWAGYTIDADFETELGGYTVILGIKMNTRGDEIDEGAFVGKLNEVRAILSQKDSADSQMLAASMLLHAAEDKPTQLGLALIAQAKTLADLAKAKPADDRGIRQRASDVVEKTKMAYSQQGIRGVAGAAFERAPQATREEQIKAMNLFKEANTKAEFEALQLQAEKAGIDIDSSLTAEHNAVGIASDLTERRKAVSQFKAALNDQLAERKPDVGLQNWQGMLVKFGFKNVNKLAHQISEQLVPYLNRLKESYIKQIEAVDAKAKRWEAGDIDTTKEKESIARREAKIAQMKEICSKRSRTSQVACQSRIKFEQSKLLKDKAILAAFIESKVSKNAKRMAAIGYRKSQAGKALKAVGEKGLTAVTATMQAIAKGIDILNITEILGQYSYRDMVNLRLPRLIKLVAELNMMDMKIPIVLQNLQFDFRNPVRSVRAIAHAIFDSTQKSMEKELLKNMPSEMQELLHEAVGG